jgi:D-3-phosphoglycerate dehydrogenase
MGPKVLIAYQDYGDDLALERQILSQIDAQVTCTYGDLVSPAALATAAQADGLMVSLQRVTPQLLDAMPRVRVVGRAGTGLDTIDLDAAAQRGVWVTYVPDYGIDEVSTHAIALMLAQARNIVGLVNSLRAGEWTGAGGRTVYRLKGQTLGVLGFGRIGQAAAEKGKGLGMNVIVYDPFLDQGAVQRLGVRSVDLDTLARESDHITLHTPLLDSTYHIVNADFLAKMKPTAYVVNTARGPLVDEAALLAAVQAGTIAGAALDVFEQEPLRPDSPLLKEERILVTSHNAWYSEEAKRDMRQRCAEDVVRVLRGEKPHRPANHVG